MIIDVSGTHATGKTTIIKALIQELIGTKVEIPSVSRTEGNLSVYEACEGADQLQISLLNWVNIIDAARNYEYVLCTDLGIRSFAYTLGAKSNDNYLQRFHEEAVRLFTSPSFRDWYNPAFLYIPIEFSMEKDGFRPEDEEYRKNIANLHKSIIDKHNGACTLRGSVEDRMASAKRYLSIRGANFK